MKMNKKDNNPKTPAKPDASRRNFLKTGVTIAGATLLADVLKSTETLASSTAQSDQDEVQYLFVQNAKNVVIAKGQLTLVGANPTTIFFSDRPKRIAGHLTTEDFVLDWIEGTGKESFHTDPPNATLSVFGKEEIVDVVVELKNPRFAGDDLIYDINVLEEEEKIPSGPVSLFIDPIGRPLSPTSVAVVHRRHRRRRRRHVVRR